MELTRLSINTNKSCFVILKAHNKNMKDVSNSITIVGNNIEQVKSITFLGLYIDEHLTQNEHIKVTYNEIAKNIGIIRKISYLLPSNILTSLVYPYLLHGNIIWASNYGTRVKPMVLLQKRIIRIIVGDKYFAHTNHRFKQLGILK